MAVFLCSVFLIISQVTVTTTITTMTVRCFGVSPITMTVMMALTATALDLDASGQHYVVLPPPLNLRYTVKGSVSLTTVLQQQQSQSQVLSLA